MHLPICHSVMELMRNPSLAADPIIQSVDGLLSGGSNIVKLSAKCTCGNFWTSELTELKLFQNTEPTWIKN